MPEIVWREHVTNANLHQHPEGCGYTNQARFSGLKLLKPAKAGFVCVATPCAGVATKLTSLRVLIRYRESLRYRVLAVKL